MNSSCGSYGVGCLGAIIGSVICAAIIGEHTYDADSTAWAILFYGSIPGLVVGAIVWQIYSFANRKK